MESEVGGAIQKMISIGDELLLFSENRVSKILTADTIDPDQSDQTTRHSYQDIYQVGSASPVVARTILQAEELLGSVHLREATSNERLLTIAWEATQHLLNCEAAQHAIYRDVLELASKCDALVESHKALGSIPSLPQVEDLEGRVTMFLGSAKRCAERIHRLLGECFGTPNLRENFQSYREWVRANRPELEDLLCLLENDALWLKQLADARNALDVNHSRDGYRVYTKNFSLAPGNKFSAPSWKFDLRARGGTQQVDFSDIVLDMNTYLGNLCGFVEDMIVLCIRDTASNAFPYHFFRKDDKTSDNEIPTRFGVTVSLEKMRGISTREARSNQ